MNSLLRRARAAEQRAHINGRREVTRGRRGRRRGRAATTAAAAAAVHGLGEEADALLGGHGVVKALEPLET